MTTQDTENQLGGAEASAEQNQDAAVSPELGNASEEGLCATPAPTVDTPPDDAVADTETKDEQPQAAAVEVA